MSDVVDNAKDIARVLNPASLVHRFPKLTIPQIRDAITNALQSTPQELAKRLEPNAFVSMHDRLIAEGLLKLGDEDALKILTGLEILWTRLAGKPKESIELSANNTPNKEALNELPREGLIDLVRIARRKLEGSHPGTSYGVPVESGGSELSTGRSTAEDSKGDI